MKKVFKWLGIIVLVLILLIVIGVTYLNTALPNVGDAPDLTVERTPERIERGRYLANSSSLCMDCHGKRDWTKFSGPVVPGTEGMGGEIFNRDMGFPGVYYSKNITPAGVGDWTDGELYRAITAGVDKDGEPMFPVMPYHYYGRMSQEDIYSIIAYVRTLPSIENDVPEREVDAPFNLIMRMIPKKAEHSIMPEPTDMVAYGAYVTNASGCRECHTNVKDGQIIEELAFSGGREFIMPGGILRTSNLTPANSGIGYWSQEQFLAKFRRYTDSNYHAATVGPMDYNTMMPWEMYARMTDRDLTAIYQYLKSLKPIENEVVKWTANKN